ncbi:zona pellucida sperm-binding protein 3 receptor-like [Mercenaria mercenaria]|uniref:zona pellucida sperm-binding protein 3 receptor-like n=1 Tax=Mercenaria mercenaria TaxID=6596 RepID=UPI00234EF65A|nr:zona pellucida sperm-binding protein 3 receptor-like [Mercenaria mercenaria]
MLSSMPVSEIQAKYQNCGDVSLVTISNAKKRLLVSDTKYNSTANISCDIGYYEQNTTQTEGISTAEIRCGDNGSWTNLPTCVRKDCHNVSGIKIDNAANRRQHYDTKYNSTADIDCDEGYYNVKDNQTTGISTTTISCSEHGTWVNMPTCVMKDCGKLDILNISNAKSRLLFGDTNYQLTAAISCDTGYTDKNKLQTVDTSASQIKSSTNRTWENVPNIDNAASRRLHNDTKYKSTADIDCDEGYYSKMQGQTAGISTTTISCSEHGTWVNIPTCERKDCGNMSPLTIPNAKKRLLVSDTKYNSTANVSCDIGYYEQNTTQTEGISTVEIRCDENGSWTNLPTCVRKDCHEVSNIIIEHAARRRVHNDTKYNSTADIDCDEGYYNIMDNQTIGISTTTIICSEHGTWVNIPTCVRKDCGKLDMLDISNAKLRLTLGDTKYQSNAVIRCDTGYTDQNKPQTLDTSATQIKCSANGTWANLPKCVKKDCGNIYNISIKNAANRRLHSDTKYTSTAEIDCDEGYYNIHDSQTTGISATTINCSEQGTWVNIPTCVRKECGGLSLLNISNAENRDPINGTKYNSIANISCDAGYKEQNESQSEGITSIFIRCDENGTWANQPTCVRKDCGDLYNISIDNAVHRRLHNDTKYMSTADIDCDEGYYNHNQTQTTGISTTTINCSEHGIWVNMPTCVQKGEYCTASIFRNFI